MESRLRRNHRLLGNSSSLLSNARIKQLPAKTRKKLKRMNFLQNSSLPTNYSSSTLYQSSTKKSSLRTMSTIRLRNNSIAKNSFINCLREIKQSTHKSTILLRNQPSSYPLSYQLLIKAVDKNGVTQLLVNYHLEQALLFPSAKPASIFNLHQDNRNIQTRRHRPQKRQ